jgi:Right handed beta helix region
MTSEVTALADQVRWKPSRWVERFLQLLLALLVSLVGVSLGAPPSAFAAGIAVAPTVPVPPTNTYGPSPTPTATPTATPTPTCNGTGIVGSGSADSCTETGLESALACGGLVTFDCGAEPVTITVTGEKLISGSVTIEGNGLVTLSGGDRVRVFRVDKLGMLDVRNLTIAHGFGFPGGGINNGGDLTVTNCTFSDNAGLGFGGGIFNEGTLTVTNSTFSTNYSDAHGDDVGFGGGIFNEGTLTVTNSTFSSNHATGEGGGINNSNSGDLTVTNCTFSGNDDGAIANDNDGTVVVTNSTFSGNHAYYRGGGIFNWGTLTVTNSTFCPNDGGAIYNGDGGAVTITNTIVAKSTNGGDCLNDGTVTDGGHNLIEDAENACGLTNGVNDTIVGVDPMLDPDGLTDNGGPTQTIALLSGSPAISGGDPDVCANPPVNGIDQRGYVRPGVGSTNCSIGAYEYNSAGPPSICVGDCDADGNVFVSEIIILVNIALGNAQPSTCPDGIPSGAEVNVTLIIQAVNAALSGCPFTAAQGCLASGGTGASAMCCVSTGDFPDTCAIGACSCAPDASHAVRVCDCGAGSCFDGSACVSQ